MTDINADTFAGHIRKLCNPNTWATHIEVLAVAAYFQVPVYFCTDPPQPNTGGTYRWECFNLIASRELLQYPMLTRLDTLNWCIIGTATIIVSIHTGVLHVSPPQLTGNIIYHSQVIEYIAAFLYMHSKSIVFFSIYTYLAVWPLNSGMIDSHCHCSLIVLCWVKVQTQTIWRHRAWNAVNKVDPLHQEYPPLHGSRGPSLSCTAK